MGESTLDQHRWHELGRHEGGLDQVQCVRALLLVANSLSIHVDLHPLALEDVFHARKQTRSKADYYPQHLFLHVLCHEAEEIGQRNLDVSRHIYPLQDSMLTENPVYDEPLSMIEEYSSDNLMDGDNSKRSKTKSEYKEEVESSSGLNKQSRQVRSRFRKKRPSLDTRGSAFSTLTSIGDSPVSISQPVRSFAN